MANRQIKADFRMKSCYKNANFFTRFRNVSQKAENPYMREVDQMDCRVPTATCDEASFEARLAAAKLRNEASWQHAGYIAQKEWDMQHQEMLDKLRWDQ